jgi:hypothetical protein
MNYRQNNRLLNNNQNQQYRTPILNNNLLNSNNNIRQIAKSYSSFDERDRIENINKQLA